MVSGTDQVEQDCPETPQLAVRLLILVDNRWDELPQIAVIMPAYNRATVIGRAIESVLAQDLRDFELVVIDDGSKDGTADIARSYPDPRVRLIKRRANRGSNAARNARIRASTAPLIAFLDSDDAYLPRKLSTVAREFDRRPGLRVLVDSFVKLCPSGDRRRRVERVNPGSTAPKSLPGGCSAASCGSRPRRSPCGARRRSAPGCSTKTCRGGRTWISSFG